ncbi:MAG: undecaprenyl-diphosphate phosphatase [Candidatus Omnitrophota bacterium]|nr:undecaprenyl-diphosphate phosphatase [Candidatus Omnitrophota bacterium]
MDTNFIHSIILGLVQGLTEFLPVSSSGHLILVPWLMGWQENSIFFDISLHLATLFAVLLYFRKDWIHILRNERRLFWYIIIATIPAGLAGLFLGDRVGEYFRNPLSVAAMLGLFGLVLYAADAAGKKNKSMGMLTLGTTFLIGLAQMLAIIPGVSRSGITMSMALLLGFNRESSVRFSFLLIAPIVLAAGCKGILDMAKIHYALPWAVFFSGFAAAFLSSIVAIHFLIKYIRTRPFAVFVIYRLLASASVAAIILFRR